jgi:hypothetical protein
MLAASELTEALRLSGELQEALQLGIETLVIVRRVHGDEHEVTMSAMSTLSSVHCDMGDDAAALPLDTEVLATR